VAIIDLFTKAVIIKISLSFSFAKSFSSGTQATPHISQRELRRSFQKSLRSNLTFSASDPDNPKFLDEAYYDEASGCLLLDLKQL